ncbi:MAG: hypothetical protein PVH74_08170 [Desulfobacterales bacterium]|jgi:hypothetical protein
MKLFFIMFATVLVLFAGQGICEENPSKKVKYVDTIYLLDSDGSILNKYNNVVVLPYQSDERIIRFFYKGKEMYHEGNVLMKGFELQKNRIARQRIGIE